MGITVKKFLFACISISLISATSLNVATAAQKAPVVKCSATKAVGHTAKTVAFTPKILTKFPKTFSLVTNCGTIVITTVGNKAPWTMTELSALAKAGYFDGSLCHRLTTAGIFVLQCGDPTASGMGGPGFSYPDENLPANAANNYPAGTVAMANSGPGTNGSQFFLVFADTSLGANYTIWGKITKGLEIVQAIAKAGVKGGGGDGTPSTTIALTKVSVN
ncbi:MAG: peptidylprolyl isomerase [Streptomycetaceae bacterium]|nr:MAG: peptidylprolyl isomerase [Streptomycetaceae bacterium]